MNYPQHMSLSRVTFDCTNHAKWSSQAMLVVASCRLARRSTSRFLHGLRVLVAVHSTPTEIYFIRTVVLLLYCGLYGPENG